MPLRERFRSAGARGIAHFLAEHQEHDAGFDVHRDAGGSGQLEVTCLGCGATVRYRATDVAAFGAAEAEIAGDDARRGPRGTASEKPASAPPRVPRPSPPAASASPPPPPAAQPQPAPPQAASPSAAPPAAPPPSPRAESEPPGRRVLPSIPRWVGTAAIAGLIAAGLLMIVIGLFTDGDDATNPSPAQEQRAPVKKQPAAQQPAAPPASAPSVPVGELRTRSFADRLTIGVAPGWRTGRSDRAVTITAPGGDARLEIYYEQGSRPVPELTDSAEAFLRDRHNGSRVSGPNPTRISGIRGERLTDRYPGGTESAVILSSGGFTYLLLERIDDDASAAIQKQADAELASFKPS